MSFVKTIMSVFQTKSETSKPSTPRASSHARVVNSTISAPRSTKERTTHLPLQDGGRAVSPVTSNSPSVQTHHDKAARPVATPQPISRQGTDTGADTDAARTKLTVERRTAMASTANSNAAASATIVQPQTRIDPPQPKPHVENGPSKSTAPNSHSISLPRKSKEEQELERAKDLARDVIDALDDARSRFDHLLAEPPETKTLAEYARIRDRLLNKAAPPNFGFRNTNTRQKARSAIIWGILPQLDTIKPRIKELVQQVRIADAIHLMKEFLSLKDALAQIDEAKHLGDPSENKQIRRSERKTLSKLPENWEATFLQAVKSNAAELYLPCCVMLATGARPAEIKKGAKVKLSPNTTLLISLHSAKHGGRKRRSVGIRSIEIPIDAPWCEGLAKAASDLGGEMTVFLDETKHLSTVLSRLSKRCGFPKGARVIPYTLRHRFGALLKGSQLQLIEQARAMGHASTTALSVYGVYNNKITRGGLPIRATSERTPKDTRKVKSKHMEIDVT